MNTLSRRIQTEVLKKCDGDKRRAIAYLRKKCSFYAYKADSKCGTPYHSAWSGVYKAYSNAEFTISYFLSLDEEYANGTEDY